MPVLPRRLKPKAMPGPPHSQKTSKDQATAFPVTTPIMTRLTEPLGNSEEMQMGFSTRTRLHIRVLMLCASVAGTGGLHAQETDIVPTAIGSLFSPQFAPTYRTMGLMQRSFVDLVEAAGPKLQVALVIDGSGEHGRRPIGAKEVAASLNGRPASVQRGGS